MTTLKLSLSLTNPPRRVPIEISSESSPKNLFKVASEATKIPLDNLKLIFRGRIIANSTEDAGNVVEEFKLEDGSVIHCMGKPAVEVAATAIAPMSTPVETPAAAEGGGMTISSPTAAPTPLPLEAALARIKRNHSATEYKAALDTLTKLLSNVIQHPMEEKYRKVKKSNAVFHKRLGRLTGASDTLLAVGFHTVVGGGDGNGNGDDDGDGEEYYVLTPSPDAWPKLIQSKETINQALRLHELELHQHQQQQQPQFSSNPPFGMNPMNFQGGMGPAFDTSVMSNILSDPNSLRDILQNPAMQQMMQNHPYFANNPMMMEQMRMLANNPQMMDQMSRMMSDPSHVSRMNEMMRSMQGSNGFGMGDVSGSGGIDSGVGGGPGAGLNMNQQMEIMRQMANMSRGVGNGGILPQIPNASTASGGTASTTAATRGNTNSGNSSSTATSNTNTNIHNDNEMTEEEMIAEAIARSLREQ